MGGLYSLYSIIMLGEKEEKEIYFLKTTNQIMLQHWKLLCQLTQYLEEFLGHNINNFMDTY